MFRSTTQLIARHVKPVTSLSNLNFIQARSYHESHGQVSSKERMASLSSTKKTVKFPKIGHDVEKETAGDVVDSSVELQKYAQKVTGTTAKYLGITGVAGATTVGTGYALSSVVPVDMLMTGGMCTMAGAFVGSLWSAWKIGSVEPTYKGTCMTNEDQREFYAQVMHGCMGITLAPSLVVFSDAIPMASVVTMALVAGPITASLKMQKGAMLSWGPALYTGLWGLIGISIGGMWFPILHDINLIGGVGLFTAYSAYDTHTMIKEFEDGNYDHIGHSANYSLNAINIFVRMLEIISRLQGGKKD